MESAPLVSVVTSFASGHTRIISDNGPQFIACDFKEVIRLCGMTHVRTAPFYPQSNGNPHTLKAFVAQRRNLVAYSEWALSISR